MNISHLSEQLREYGVGRRKLDDPLFVGDEALLRLGVYDVDDEDLCHNVIKVSCHIPGCNFTSETLLQFENHYNATHRYSCVQCKKVLPSAHLLDLHIQEKHDSYFAAMAERTPAFSCYIEECKEKFINPESRKQHCIDVHKLPKDFRFDQKPKNKKAGNFSNTNENFRFNNSKHKSFNRFSGQKFTKNQGKHSDVDMDAVISELKESLPE